MICNSCKIKKVGKLYDTYLNFSGEIQINITQCEYSAIKNDTTIPIANNNSDFAEQAKVTTLPNFVDRFDVSEKIRQLHKKQEEESKNVVCDTCNATHDISCIYTCNDCNKTYCISCGNVDLDAESDSNAMLVCPCKEEHIINTEDNIDIMEEI